jgi:2'-5' RNA ligase
MHPTTVIETNSPSERYVVVYLLPRTVQLQIEDMYLHWQGITRPPMGYHLSALGPFVIAAGHSPDDLSVIGDLCTKLSSFHLLLGEPGIFRNSTSQVAYLGLYNPEPMRALHGALLDSTQGIVAAPSPEYHLWTVEQYVPHVTLGIGLNEEAASEFLMFARRHSCKLNCQVQELSLLEQLGNGVWQQQASYKLLGKRSRSTT